MEEIDWALLTRYLSGTCSDAERRDVEHWMNERPNGRRLVRELEDLWRMSSHPREAVPHPEDYVDADWERMRSMMAGEQQAAGGASGSLRLIDREQTRRRTPASYFLRVAAVLVVLVGAGLLTWRMDGSGERETASTAVERVVATDVGQRGSLTLSDGTVVHLNVRSRLEYPGAFQGSRREVYLDGEAFFEVASDQDRPFIVHANGATVRVRGTAFGVRAYEADDEVKVVVVEGKVDLSVEEPASGHEERVSLSKADMGKVVGGRLQGVVGDVDPARHLSWQEGRLVFVDAPFERVASDLENWYGLRITIREPHLARRTLTASFKDEPLEVVLQVTATALNAQYRRKGHEVVFFLQDAGVPRTHGATPGGGGAAEDGSAIRSPTIPTT